MKRVKLILIVLLTPSLTFCQGINDEELLFQVKLQLFKYAFSGHNTNANDSILDFYFDYEMEIHDVETFGFDTSENFFFSVKIESFADTLHPVQVTPKSYLTFTFFNDLDGYSLIYVYDKKNKVLILLNGENPEEIRTILDPGGMSVCSEDADSVYIDGLDVDCLCNWSNTRLRRNFLKPYLNFDCYQFPGGLNVKIR